MAVAVAVAAGQTGAAASEVVVRRSALGAVRRSAIGACDA